MNILSRIPSPLSIEGAYLWFQVFSLLFLAATILTGAGTIITGFIANRRTTNALAIQQERAASAEKDLFELKERERRRRLPRWAILAGFGEYLKGKPAGSVEIIFVPENEEAQKTALGLWAELSGGGKWRVLSIPRPYSEADILPRFLTPAMKGSPVHIPLFERVGGVSDITVLASEADFRKDQPGLLKEGTPVEALWRGFLAWGFETIDASDPRLPSGTARIVIGPKP